MSQYGRVQVSLERTTALPADRIVNTWYVQAINAGENIAEHAEDITTALQAWYNTMANWMSDLLTGVGSVDVYDMADAEPRVPVYSETGTLYTVQAGTSLPAEVALCLSFKGATVSGVNMARRRGRIFVGPLNTASMAGESSGDQRPHANFVTDLEDATDTMVLAWNGLGADGVRHAVYSPTQDAAGSLSSAFTVVDHYWVDNAFDTQRRRGVAASARTTWDSPASS